MLAHALAYNQFFSISLASYSVMSMCVCVCFFSFSQRQRDSHDMLRQNIRCQIFEIPDA